MKGNEMKNIIIILLICSYVQATIFSPKEIKQHGLSIETVCKNGYLTDIITGTVKDNKIRVEQLTCIRYSSWDGECSNDPIKCKEK